MKQDDRSANGLSDARSENDSLVDVECDYAYANITVRIVAPSGLHRRLAEYFAGFVEVRESTGPCETRVVVRCDARLLRDTRRKFRLEQGTEIELHGRLAGILIHDEDTGLVWNLGEDASYRCRHAGSARELVITYDSPTIAAALDCARIVRGLMTRLAEMRGARRVHMACLVRDGRGVAVVGPTGSGKTTFLLQSLRSGAGDSFVTNDKAMLVERGRELVVFGVPYAVSIGDGTLSVCAPLSRERGRRINGETYLWPTQIASALGCSLLDRTVVVAMICVGLDPASEGASLVRMDVEECRADIDTFTEAMHPHWLDQLIGTTPAASGAPDAIKEIPCWELRGNPMAMDPEAVLSRVVSGSRGDSCSAEVADRPYGGR